MAFDPFGGGGAPQGSHVVFAPVAAPPSHNWDWGRPQVASPLAPSQQPQQQPSFRDAIQQALADRLETVGGAESTGVRRIQGSAEDGARAIGRIVIVFDGIGAPRSQPDQARLEQLEARRQEAERQEAVARSTAEVLAEQAIDSGGASPSLNVARRLPGSPADGYRYMETLRHDEKILDERRAHARKMAQKDDEMAYRD